MTIAKASRSTAPITIPPIAAIGSTVWCGISAGMAVEVDVEVDDAVLNGTTKLEAGVPRKSAAAFGSLLNLMASKSTAEHPPNAHGLLLQHPMNGPG